MVSAGCIESLAAAGTMTTSASAASKAPATELPSATASMAGLFISALQR